ncbi:MAG: hypothetical protein LBD18_04525, partial [Treponema sp.]|nr:hypothetical protein [Treponema sp.]
MAHVKLTPPPPPPYLTAKFSTKIYVFGLVLAFLGFALGSCQQPSNAAGPESGGIIGKALYSGGQSHANIAVSLEKTDGLRSLAVASAARTGAPTARTLAASVLTKEDGSYQFSNISPGVYTVYAVSKDSKEKAVAVNVT